MGTSVKWLQVLTLVTAWVENMDIVGEDIWSSCKNIFLLELANAYIKVDWKKLMISPACPSVWYVWGLNSLKGGNMKDFTGSSSCSSSSLGQRMCTVISKPPIFYQCDWHPVTCSNSPAVECCNPCGSDDICCCYCCVLFVYILDAELIF